MIPSVRCCLVNRQRPWKKTLTEKKMRKLRTIIDCKQENSQENVYDGVHCSKTASPQCRDSKSSINILDQRFFSEYVPKLSFHKKNILRNKSNSLLIMLPPYRAQSAILPKTEFTHADIILNFTKVTKVHFRSFMPMPVPIPMSTTMLSSRCRDFQMAHS